MLKERPEGLMNFYVSNYDELPQFPMPLLLPSHSGGCEEYYLMRYSAV
jgi:hypothetical protein